MTWVLSILTAAAACALVWAEVRGSALRLIAKPLASAGFLGVALTLNPLNSAYGRWILAGLALGAIGDVALLGQTERRFLGGLVAFLLGHLAYLIALAPAASPPALWIAVPVAAAFTIRSMRWVVPSVSGRLRGPVVIYSLVIGGMLASALSAAGAHPVAAAGAVLFSISDLAVASDRFVRPGRQAFVWGLPLYYGGQVLIALSVGG